MTSQHINLENYDILNLFNILETLSCIKCTEDLLLMFEQAQT